MTKKLILFSLIATVSACTMPEHNYLPRFVGYKTPLLYGVPEGDDSFSVGWRDGCNTSLAIAGEGALRLIKEKIDADNSYRFNKDQRYDKGYTTGSGYCANFLDYNSG